MKPKPADVFSLATRYGIAFSLLFFFLSSCHKPSSTVSIAPVDTVVQRAIAQKAPADTLPKKKTGKKKKLYLTFDDGPNKGTSNVLAIMKDEQIPVSFFVVGEHVFASNHQAAMWDSLQMAERVAICNHSYSHAGQRYTRYYQQPDSVVRDFERTNDSLHLSNTVARTPGRNIWRIDSLRFTDLPSSAAAADSLAKAGFKLLGWDLEWHFDHNTMAVKQSANEMMQQIDSAFAKNKTKRAEHLVLLAHDQVYAKSDDSAKLRQFLKLLKAKGEYDLSLATDYPGAMPAVVGQ